MKYLNTLPNSFIVGEKDNDGNILEQYGFPKGGLTYLIKGNNIKFYLTEDYFYKNVVFSADAPFLINGIPVSVDNLPAALKNIFRVEQEQVDVDTEFNTESFNPIANAPVAIRFNDVDSTIDSLSGEVQTKADIEDIPTNVSELVNDAGYITEESISEDYATKVWVQEQGYVTDISGKQDVSGMTAYTTNDAFSTHTGNTDIHVTANEKETWNNKSDFSGSYNDLTDKPTIPVVPTNVSAFNNDAGYVTQNDIDESVSGKADTSAVTASLAALDEKKLDASAYTPTDLSNYYTKDETSGATEIATALDGKADIEDIPTNISELVNDEGYVTQNDIDAAVSGKVNTTDFNTYSAATDNRLSEDEEVTAAALNALNAVSGDVNTLSGQVATISGDVNTLSGSVESLHGAVSAVVGDVSTLSGKVNTDETILTGHTANTDIHVTASDKQNWNNKSDFSGDYNDLTNKPTIPTVPTNVSDFVNDAGYATSGYVDSSVSGKMDTSTFNTYSANTDARLSEDEEVTAAALNSLNSNKQDKLTAGSGITISNNVISCTVSGGGSTYSAGRGIDITNDIISFNLPISAGTGTNSVKESYQNNNASGDYSHAEGISTNASGIYSHAEGQSTIAGGTSSHAEGSSTLASGLAAHAEGYHTEAKNNGEHASGLYNVSKTGLTADNKTLFSVGNGTDNNRHNAFEIRQNGDIYFTKDGSDVKLQDQLDGGVPESAFTAYTASTEARLAEDEEVTAAGLNALNDALSGKQDTLSAGTNITISGNVISAEGGGKAISAGTNISVTTGETADTVNCTLPIMVAKNNANSIIIGNGTGNAWGANCILAGNSARANFENCICVGSSLTAGAKNSQVFGDRTSVQNEDEHVTGRLNISNKANTTFGNSGNTLFSVGNGYVKYPIQGYHNAFEIRQNGDIYIADTNDTTYQNYYEKPMIKLQDALGGGGLPESAFTAHTADTTIHTTSAEKASWNGAATNASNAITALGGLKLVQLTQAEYNALATKDTSTLYIIVN